MNRNIVPVVANPIDDYPEARRWLYFVQWLITGVQTVLSATFAFVFGDLQDWPRWFLGSLAVAPVLWAYLGVTAKNNVPSA